MDKKDLTFEEKLENLEKIVSDLESGDIPLDNAIEKFNEAMKIANDCNKTLEKANETVTKVLSKEEVFEDFDIKD